MFEILLFLGLVSSPSLEIPPNTSIPAVIEPLESPKIDLLASFDEEAVPYEVKCLCVAFSRLFIHSIPYPRNAEDLEPNGSPDIGSGALFRYNEVSHLAVITEYTEEGFMVIEANKEPCTITRREVYWSDPYLKGFLKG